MLRTHDCGELTRADVGKKVRLSGWVDTVRDHGGMTFVDLRDRYGKTQVLFDPKRREGAKHPFKPEDCVWIEGEVNVRPEGTENSKLVTGEIEVVVTKSGAYGATAPLPFEVTKSSETNEELRLKYRYLDLRNPEVQKNFLLRHKVCQAIRRSLDERGFIEVETPILTKSTPEGARDYLVPSRLNPGEFYALPQSPQLFKQILMISGLDRYFQIAKCFRDEDLRADRQPEFTQLDMEMSFLEENDLFKIMEELMVEIVATVGAGSPRPEGAETAPLQLPFPRMTYEEAMNRYGADKPDLRFGLAIEDLSDLLRDSEFQVFNEALAGKGGGVYGFCVTSAQASRKDLDNLTEFVKAEGAKGLAYFKATESGLESPIAKFFNPEDLTGLERKFGAAPGDLILVVADEKKKALKTLGALRLHAAEWKNLIKAGEFRFCWVTDFPLFKYNQEEERWESEHHPFTSPNEEDWKKYAAGATHTLPLLGKIRSRAYDLVLNGNEIASGSVRIHDRALQREIFRTIGLDEKEAQSRFGFLLRAFEFGAPPHGGIALGIDRILALLLGLDSIREVIAFPKNQKAVDPMTEAPSPANERQLKELGIKIL